ncbi:cysteine desulfurase family protein [Nannocystaceae bacterium ST9]
MIDLDHAATTPLDPRVREAMFEVLGDPEAQGNPSSVHRRGQRARALVEQARRRLAAALGVEPLDVTFTSGGTESDALALLGTARALRAAGRPSGVLSSPIEHAAVLESCALLAAEGHARVFVPVDDRGRIDPQALLDTLARHPEIGLVSLAAANHELGNRYPIPALVAALRERRPDLVIHCDAVQAFGKRAIDVRAWDVDLLSVSSHKIHGPKGAGALIHRKSSILAPLWKGGTQERGRRVGTENPLALHGFGLAAELAMEELDERADRVAALGQRLREVIAGIEGASIEGDPDHAPGTITGTITGTIMATFAGCSGELLAMNLDLDGIAVSTGAACSAGTLEPSKVLLALGHPRERAASALRFSIGHDNQPEHIERLAELLPGVVARVRSALR